jgi:hypothetical protein
MDHWKAKIFVFPNGIRDFRSFGQSNMEMLRSVLPLFCPETEFSSGVDSQNSVASKPFSGQSHMSIG